VKLAKPLKKEMLKREPFMTVLLVLYQPTQRIGKMRIRQNGSWHIRLSFTDVK
jgi:hypothetical protein